MKSINLSKKNILLIAFTLLFLNNSLISSLKSERSLMDSISNEENFLEENSNTNLKEELEYAVPATNSTAVMSAEGWLKISSSEFKNTVKFPSIEISGKKFSIKTDKRLFRINTIYDPKKTGAENPKSNLDFYFRLVNNLIYYTVNKKDVNMLGSIEIKSVKEKTMFLPGQEADDLCFTVADTEGNDWDICADDKKTSENFICKIRTSLGIPCKKTGPKANENKTNTTSLETQTYQPVIVIPVPAKECNAFWDYDSKGKNWECACAEGIEQSPINIPEISNVIESPVTPYFTFKTMEAKSPITTIDGEIKSQENIKIRFFKNALRILHNDIGKIVTLDGSVYIGEEIVFHTPAEHKLNGRKMDMEMQVIYYGRSKGDIAKQVVLSFLFEQRPGVYNKFLEDLDIFNLPNESIKEKDLRNDLFIPKIFYNSDDEIDVNSKPFSFYTYQGSLTMPPCSEGTIHYVVADPIPIGAVVIQLFREALKKENSDYVLENARKTQPLNGRKVFFFDKEKYDTNVNLPRERAPATIPGHYERIKKQKTMYQWVNNSSPSKYPGAIVVPQREVEKILSSADR